MLQLKNATKEIKNTTEYVHCNLCGDDDTELIFITTDLAFHLPGEFRLVKCKTCGLAYLNPRPSKAAIGQYYPAAYEPHKSYAASVPPLKKILWRAWDFYNKCFINDLTFLWFLQDRPVGRVLEIGCGGGTYLKMLQDRGWDSYGTDISPEAVATARNLGLKVYQGELPDQPFGDHFFDAIVLKHALEHVPDPYALLSAAHRMLSADGILMIAVPNIKCWEAQLFGKYWFPLETPRHLYHFTRETLTALLWKAQFAVTEVNYEYSAEPLGKSLSYLTGRKLEKLLVNYLAYGLLTPIQAGINALRSEGCILVVRAGKAST